MIAPRRLGSRITLPEQSSCFSTALLLLLNKALARLACSDAASKSEIDGKMWNGWGISRWLDLARI